MLFLLRVLGRCLRGCASGLWWEGVDAVHGSPRCGVFSMLWLNWLDLLMALSLHRRACRARREMQRDRPR